jgi:hypothetical protein
LELNRFVLLYPYQIDALYYCDTERIYLEEFFKKTTLIITEHTLTYSRQTLTDIVDKFGNIDQIVIDVTHNPYHCDEPALQNAYNLLSDLAPTVILSGDFSLFYHPRPNFIFFPVFLWAFSLRNPVWYQRVVFDTHQNKNKLLCCFNKSPWRHRTLLFLSLVEYPWFDQIQYTFGNFDTRYHRFELDFLNNIQKAKFDQYSHLLPISILGDELINQNDVGISNSAYSDCLVNIITETSIDANMFTEKTTKSFMAYQVPILLSSPGSTQFLQDIGLDMFSDIIPWKSWDNIVDIQTRIDLIVNFVDGFIDQDVTELYNSLADRLEFNKQYFHSVEFRNILLAQMTQLR